MPHGSGGVGERSSCRSATLFGINPVSLAARSLVRESHAANRRGTARRDGVLSRFRRRGSFRGCSCSSVDPARGCAGLEASIWRLTWRCKLNDFIRLHVVTLGPLRALPPPELLGVDGAPCRFARRRQEPAQSDRWARPPLASACHPLATAMRYPCSSLHLPTMARARHPWRLSATIRPRGGQGGPGIAEPWTSRCPTGVTSR
jgi:hypothetical protein